MSTTGKRKPKRDTPIPVIWDPPVTPEQWAASEERAMRAAGCVPVSESRKERPARGRPNASAVRVKEEAACPLTSPTGPPNEQSPAACLPRPRQTRR